ncbi:hypothetical protein TB2_008583 [Malus domestica]
MNESMAGNGREPETPNLEGLHLGPRRSSTGSIRAHRGSVLVGPASPLRMPRMCSTHYRNIAYLPDCHIHSSSGRRGI